jgi:hypothetical protein
LDDLTLSLQFLNPFFGSSECILRPKHHIKGKDLYKEDMGKMVSGVMEYWTENM